MFNLRHRLQQASPIVFSIYAIVAAFSTYACMYAFRRPFSVATFDGMTYGGLDYKTILIIAQVIGYMLSKFIGIKVVSEIQPGRRALMILSFIGLAEVTLLGFWLVPSPYNIPFLFLNGLPLGMIWGFVFSYLEGRRLTELLGAGLSISFIVSSGVVKSVGAWTMLHWGVSEFAMPFVTGLLFAGPLLGAVWLLDQLPPPSAEDEAQRTPRRPMQSSERRAFFGRFAVGITGLTVIYMFLTAYRDLRDNYAVEIVSAIGFADDAAIFTQTEVPIALVVLVIIGALFLIRDNLRAFLVNHAIVFGGIALIGGSTAAFQAGLVPPYAWMVLTGLGTYLAYVPFNCILFDRFIASYRTVANAGFLIYIADAFGYLASVGLLLYKNFGQAEVAWYDFFVQFSYVIAIVGCVLTAASALYFQRSFARVAADERAKSEPQPVAAGL